MREDVYDMFSIGVMGPWPLSFYKIYILDILELKMGLNPTYPPNADGMS